MSTEALAKTARNSQWTDAKGFKGFLHRNRFIFLSFLIPFAIMTVAFAIMGVSPFGDKQILVTDLWHQYYPFLVDYQDKLKTGSSLFYSWTQGGGTNYFALISYYLASPMNFLSVFIPGDWLREFLAFSVVVKIALAGMFMAVFLRYTFKKNDYSLVMFSLCFAVCSFFMGYYWNTIWLDTVALTPLVAMGTIALMREGKFRLFVVTLALSVLANYYIGFFTCIFVAIIYIGYTVCRWKGFKSFMLSLGKIAGFSACALGITAFLILPAFFALQNTHATSSVFPSAYAINIGAKADFMGTMDAIKQVISNSIAFVSPSTKEGLPNIYCGTICIVLGIMFLTSKKVKLKEKIFSSVLLLFFVLSFVIRQLDYIWHGFHFTNMIPYRFSYLFSFVLVVMAFRAFMLIDFSNFLDVIIAGLGTSIVILLSIGTQKVYSIVGTAVISLIILVMLFLFTKKIIPKQVMSIVLFIVVLAEAGATGYIGVKTTTVTGTADYPRGEQNTANVISAMKAREDETTELYRAETTSTQTLNDASLNLYNGLSMFNSMTNESMTIFMENFGLMGWQAGNRYTYAESSPVSDLFMNLKYLISRDGNYRNNLSWNEVYQSGNVKLLESKNYIPMGFMTNTQLLNWKVQTTEDTYNPFDQQNAFFKMATGLTEDVYTPVQVSSQGHTDYEKFPVNKTSYGNYSFSSKDSTEAPHLKWNYEVEEPGLYCAYTLISNGDNLTVMKNNVSAGSSIYIKRPYIMSIGYFDKGDTLSLYCDLKAGASGNAQIYCCKFNEDVFNKGYDILNQRSMKTTTLTSSSMEGTIDAGDGGLFYTSVPYEEGWTAYVDGKETAITPVGDALVAFELSEGEHTIKLNYIPKGFVPGAIVSLLALAAFIAAIIFFRKKWGLTEEQNAQLEDALSVNATPKTTVKSQTVKKQTSSKKKKK